MRLRPSFIFVTVMLVAAGCVGGSVGIIQAADIFEADGASAWISGHTLPSHLAGKTGTQTLRAAEPASRQPLADNSPVTTPSGRGLVVVEQPAPLLLGMPTASPTGIEPTGEKETKPVVFRSLVSGTSEPNGNVLYLDRIELSGEPTKDVIELNDYGKDPDALAGDRIYTGRYDINQTTETELRFRVRASYAGKEVVSDVTTFMVTRISLKARPSNFDLVVPLSGTPSRVFSNEVVVEMKPGMSSAEVKEIAGRINGTVKAVIPPLRLYLIEFPNTRGSQGVVDALATLSRHPYVVVAEPNHLVVPAGICFNHPENPDVDPQCDNNECDPSDTGTPCPDDGGNQWYLGQDYIGARKAWEIFGGGDPSAGVAVVEGGVLNCQHEDLKEGGRCCTYDIELGKCTDSGGTYDHGTQVAGIIAANANNNKGIAGVAWNTKVYAINLTVNNSYALYTALRNCPHAKIVNISKGFLHDPPPSPGPTLLKNAICDLMDEGKLIVTAGRNVSFNPDTLFPAAFSHQATPLICERNNPPPDCENNKMCTFPLDDQLLAVGAHNEENLVSGSDAGYLDIYAPGVNILTLTGTNGTTRVDGTSFATPLVSAAAAVLWAYDGSATATDIHNQLIALAVPVDTICSKCKRLNLKPSPTQDAPPDTPGNVRFIVGDGSMSRKALSNDTVHGVDGASERNPLNAEVVTDPSSGRLALSDDGYFSLRPHDWNAGNTDTDLSEDCSFDAEIPSIGAKTVNPVYNDSPSTAFTMDITPISSDSVFGTGPAAKWRTLQ